jgi:SWI/SNF-related matrix-associated actin-dependent regulator 1 of chromatin subfamily A
VKIGEILNWQDLGIRPTPLGTRRVMVADPTEDFWKAWRKHKNWFQERGVFVKMKPHRLQPQGPGARKEFDVHWYVAIPETPTDRMRREASRSESSSFRFPVPNGIVPYPYQRAGVEFMFQHADDAILLADEMGLGKTPQSIFLCNILRPTTVLIVAPASLLRNWQREWTSFSTLKHLKIHRVEKDGDFPRTPNVVIVSMDSCWRKWLKDKIHGITWDVVIVDEAHKLCNEEAHRSRAILGGGGVKTSEEHPSIKTNLKMLITGTPITNRVEQSWNLLRWLWPHEFGNKKLFQTMYCDAKFNGGRRDTSGASNLDQFQDKLRTLGMIRRLKANVLKELPPKVRQVIELPGKIDLQLNKATLEFEMAQENIEELRARRDLAEASADENALAIASAKLKEAMQIRIDAMSRVRRLTAVAKAPLVVQHVKDCMEAGADKILIGAHHKELVEILMNELAKFGAVKITGSCSKQSRDKAVQDFQKDPKCKIMVASILAAGVGLTLTASCHTVMAEVDWVPANIIQFEDRTHRIGQEAESVLYQYLVIEGSLDARMINACVKKMAVAKDALDTIHETDESAINEVASILDIDDVPADDGKKTSYEVGKELPWEQVDAIHGCLKLLAKYDDDRASTHNGVGFSKYDSVVGNSLAQSPKLSYAQAGLGLKLVTKYRKQLLGLSKSLLEKATGLEYEQQEA